MEIIHTARFGRWVAVVHEDLNPLPQMCRYTITLHCNGMRFNDDKNEAIAIADSWVKEKHLQDCQQLTEGE